MYNLISIQFQTLAALICCHLLFSNRPSLVFDMHYLDLESTGHLRRNFQTPFVSPILIRLHLILVYLFISRRHFTTLSATRLHSFRLKTYCTCSTNHFYHNHRLLVPYWTDVKDLAVTGFIFSFLFLFWLNGHWPVLRILLSFRQSYMTQKENFKFNYFRHAEDNIVDDAYSVKK